MIPGTGSAIWDLVLQIALVLAMLVGVVLMIRSYWNR
jgi:hypothetical protein